MTPEQLVAANAALAGFDLVGPLTPRDFSNRGNINMDAYLVTSEAADERGTWLLQRINETVFTKPRQTMTAMVACLEAQRRGMERFGLGPDLWQPIELVAAKGGGWHVERAEAPGAGVWRLMRLIEGVRSFKSLSDAGGPQKRRKLALEAGRGLALFGSLMSELETDGLASPLPGYRDTVSYYAQFESVASGCRSLAEAAPVLPADDELRESTQEHFYVHLSPEDQALRRNEPRMRKLVDYVRSQHGFAMTLVDQMAAGSIRTVGIHGDTKVENFLFSSSTGKAIALVDLDTIMPHTWLSDWGDMVRSLCNIAGERVPETRRVKVNLGVFEALARGYLSAVRGATEAELALMVAAPRILAVELGMRFLADYLRGDTYFRLAADDPKILNATRANVQLTLARRFSACEGAMQAIIDSIRAEIA